MHVYAYNRVCVTAALNVPTSLQVGYKKAPQIQNIQNMRKKTVQSKLKTNK